jgi:hypothetical protein
VLTTAAAGALAAAGAAAAEGSFQRLVVAPERVTLFARPTISGLGEPVRLFASVDNGKAGEVVGIQAKDCGQQFFRGVRGGTTGPGGTWTDLYYPSVNTTLRAVWKGAASAPVTIRKRAGVFLRQRSAKTFSVVAGIGAGTYFERKRVLFQRFDRRLGTWTTVRQVVLTELSSRGTRVAASLPKGTPVRGVIPLSQARPCYAAGYSPVLRVR